MRFLTLFFACYLTLLGCLPCTDEMPCVETTHQATVSAAHHDLGTSHGGTDWCSPLCQCHCCAGFALLAVPALALADRPAVTLLARRFAVPAPPAVPTQPARGVWQPPRA